MEFYRLGKIIEHITAEQKALNDPYNDPAKLNFKFFIDFEKTSGLFAAEENTNSALAYLSRIGETTRHKLLSKFIENFKGIIEHYEYLFMSVEGLEIIQNANPSATFGGESDKITLKMLEASDFKINSLLTTYRYILFDDIRGVEVLPTNLQRFDCQVFVYNYGYYNSILYDKNDKTPEDSVEHLIFPTIKKVTQNDFSSMNHVLFNIDKCKFDVKENGKDFLSSVSNNMDSEALTNNITFGFKFAGVDARYNNLMGEFNFGALMALSSIQRNHELGVSAVESQNLLFDEERNNQIKDDGLFSFQKRQFSQLKNYIGERKKIIDSTIENYKSDAFKKQVIQKFADSAVDLGKNTPFIRGVLDKVQNIKNLGDELTVDNMGNKLLRKAKRAVNNYDPNPDVNANIKISEQNPVILQQSLEAERSSYRGITKTETNIYDGNL